MAGKGKGGKYLPSLSMTSYSIFLISIFFRHNMRQTCSDHSNVGDSTAILLVPAIGREGGVEGRKSKKVKECQGVCRQF